MSSNLQDMQLGPYLNEKYFERSWKQYTILLQYDSNAINMRKMGQFCPKSFKLHKIIHNLSPVSLNRLKFYGHVDGTLLDRKIFRPRFGSSILQYYSKIPDQIICHLDLFYQKSSLFNLNYYYSSSICPNELKFSGHVDGTLFK